MTQGRSYNFGFWHSPNALPPRTFSTGVGRRVGVAVERVVSWHVSLYTATQLAPAHPALLRIQRMQIASTLATFGTSPAFTPYIFHPPETVPRRSVVVGLPAADESVDASCRQIAPLCASFVRKTFSSSSIPRRTPGPGPGPGPRDQGPGPRGQTATRILPGPLGGFLKYIYIWRFGSRG